MKEIYKIILSITLISCATTTSEAQMMDCRADLESCLAMCNEITEIEDPHNSIDACAQMCINAYSQCQNYNACLKFRIIESIEKNLKEAAKACLIRLSQTTVPD